MPSRIIEKTVPIAEQSSNAGSYRTRQDGESQTNNKTYVKTADGGTGSPISNNLAKQQPTGGAEKQKRSGAKAKQDSANGIAINGLTPSAAIRPDHYSMYNGQVWFEPANQAGRFLLPKPSRRASSAPSAASLDSALHLAINSPAGWRNQPIGGRFGGSVTPRDASGQFFPNTIGYMENLAALTGLEQRQRFELEAAYGSLAGQQQAKLSRRHRYRKVVPMDTLDGVQDKRRAVGQLAPSKPPRLSMHQDSGHSNEAFEQDLEAGSTPARRHLNAPSEALAGAERASRSRRAGSAASLSEPGSGSSRSSSQNESLVLDSDQELLGFDSTGTPIIATHTRASVKPLLVDVLETAPVGSLAGPRDHRDRRDRQPQQRAAQRPAAGTREDRLTGSSGRTAAASSSIHSVAPAGGGSETRAVASPSEARSKPPGDGDASDGRANANEPAKGDQPEQPEQTRKQEQSEEQRRLEQSKVRKASSQGDLMSELNERLSRRQQTVDLPRGAVAEAKLAGRNEPEADVATTTKLRGKLQPRRAVKSASSESSAGDKGELGTGANAANHLRDMKNGELLEKQSIFAITYSGLATDKLPAEA